MEKIVDILHKSQIFKGVDRSEIIALIKESNYMVKRFVEGDIVAFKDEELNHFIFIIKGGVKTEMQKASGEAMNIDRLEEGEIIAPGFIFGKNNRFPVDIIACCETSLLYIRREEFVKLMQKNSSLLFNFLNMISSRAQFLAKKIWKSFSNKSIKEKIIDYLLENEKNGIVMLKGSLQELADSFQVARPSLSRVIGELSEMGYIEKSGRREIVIKSRSGLEGEIE